MDSLGSLAQGMMNRAVSIPSGINDVVMENVMPLLESLGDAGNDADITTDAMLGIRKRKLRTHHGRNKRQRSKNRRGYPATTTRRVRRRKRVRKEKPSEEIDNRLKNHKIDFFSETMERYLKHREMLAEGAMKVGV